MKKTVTVVVNAIPASEVEKTIYVCDVPGCKSVVHPHMSGWHDGHKCIMCERDMCKDHTFIDPYSDSDYPFRYCTICADLYVEANREMEQKHQQEEEDFFQKCKKESLAWHKK